MHKLPRPVGAGESCWTLDRLNPTIDQLTAAVEQEARKRPDGKMTHPGLGLLTAFAYVLIVGTPARFPRGKQVGNYWDGSERGFQR